MASTASVTQAGKQYRDSAQARSTRILSGRLGLASYSWRERGARATLSGGLDPQTPATVTLLGHPQAANAPGLVIQTLHVPPDLNGAGDTKHRMVQALLLQGMSRFYHRAPKGPPWFGDFGRSPGYTDLHSRCAFARPCPAEHLTHALETDTFNRN